MLRVLSGYTGTIRSVKPDSQTHAWTVATELASGRVVRLDPARIYHLEYGWGRNDAQGAVPRGPIRDSLAGST